MIPKEIQIEAIRRFNEWADATEELLTFLETHKLSSEEAISTLKVLCQVMRV